MFYGFRSKKDITRIINIDTGSESLNVDEAFP